MQPQYSPFPSSIKPEKIYIVFGQHFFIKIYMYKIKLNYSVHIWKMSSLDFDRIVRGTYSSIHTYNVCLEKGSDQMFVKRGIDR